MLYYDLYIPAVLLLNVTGHSLSLVEPPVLPC